MKTALNQTRSRPLSAAHIISLLFLATLLLPPGVAHGQTEAPESAAANQNPEPAGTEPSTPPPSPLEQLKSPIREVRYKAAIALGKRGDRSAILALIEALSTDRNQSVRSAAAWSLGALSARVAIPNLRLAAEKDDSDRVRMAAMKALVKLGVAPERRQDVVRVRVVRQERAVDPREAFYNTDEYTAGRRMRTAGIVLTIIGGTLGPLVGGVGLSAANDETSGSSRHGRAVNIAVTGFVGGGISLLVGLPLWAVGQKNISRAWDQFQGSAMAPRINLAITRDYQGLAARWRF